MPGAHRTLGSLTLGSLVAVACYTAALGGNSWLWLGWSVLALLTLLVFLYGGS